jgi:integrase
MIRLALSCGLRRAEIFRCRVDDLHHDNAYIVARKNDGTKREIPYTSAGRGAIAEWLDFRARVNPAHDWVWLNLWGRNTLTEPMTQDTFERLLLTYVGEGWTFRRLRDTCAVEWIRAGLSLANLQTIMGHRSMKDTLPYLAAVGGDVRRQIERLEPKLALSEPPHPAA